MVVRTGVDLSMRVKTMVAEVGFEKLKYFVIIS